MADDEILDESNAKEIVSSISDFENLGIELTSRDDLDADAFSQFKRSITYHQEVNKFEVGIPWRGGKPPQDLPTNYYIVLNMFKSLMRKLDRTPVKREQYKHVHLTEVASDFVEKVPPSEF